MSHQFPVRPDTETAAWRFGIVASEYNREYVDGLVGFAKDELLARFTREYLENLLVRHAGNASAAARDAQIDRNWIVALARRHGVRVRD